MRKSLAVLVCCLLVLPLSAQLTIVVDQWPTNTPPSDTLFFAGTVNNWITNDYNFRFRKHPSGKLVLPLPDSTTLPFEFKITRGSWEKVETDSIGGFMANRKFASQQDTLYIQIQSWDDLPVPSRYGWANLHIVEWPKNTPQEASIYAVGSFNGWVTDDPNYKLQKKEDGTFSIRIPLLSDTTFYKFCRGNWETIEGRRSGRARFNRQLVLGQDDPEQVIIKIESWEDLAGNPINFYTFLLLLAAFQGLLLILAINTLQNNNRAANRVLSVLLLMLSVALVGRVSTYDRDIFNWMPKLLLLPDFIYFLYAPIFWVYINRLLRLPAQKDSVVRWWHFVPFLLQLLFYIPLIFMAKEAFIAKTVDQELKSFFAWAGGLALLFNIGYWFVCRKTILQYEQDSGDSHAFEPNLQFLNAVMWLQLACLLIWLATYVVGAIGWWTSQDLSPITDRTTDTLWIAFSLTIFFLGYYTMRQPEIFKLPPVEDIPSSEGQEEQEKAASLNLEELDQIKEKLNRAMAQNQPYRNPGLSLNKMADLAGTNAHSLSRIINEGYGMNFNDFVNSYRIEEFKRLVHQEEYKNHTLLAIAFIVGFNSKSAFNRSFKKLENCTPREYLQKTT